MKLKTFSSAFIELYGTEAMGQFERYKRLITKFETIFKQTEWHLFSTPGRTEIGGNHTDHNHGRVLAASVNLDSIAVAAKNGQNKVTIYSEGYQPPFQVELDDLQVNEIEKGSTTALIRGIAARFKELTYKIGGFNAWITSDVLPGSGLSSSASIEILIASIFNALFNQNRIPPQELALVGQYAENHYFGKPCGLMDQMTCAVGGIVSIDFKDSRKPAVSRGSLVVVLVCHFLVVTQIVVVLVFVLVVIGGDLEFDRVEADDLERHPAVVALEGVAAVHVVLVDVNLELAFRADCHTASSTGRTRTGRSCRELASPGGVRATADVPTVVATGAWIIATSHSGLQRNAPRGLPLPPGPKVPARPIRYTCTE